MEHSDFVKNLNMQGNQGKLENSPVVHQPERMQKLHISFKLLINNSQN
jgi:hypothetical protein